MQRVEMEGEVAGAAVQPQHASAFVVDGAAAQFGAALEWLIGQSFRYAAVDHIDRAADRTAAVEQGGRALQDFDLVGEERLDADGVVDADRRYVAGTQSVAQHLHSCAVEAA